MGGCFRTIAVAAASMLALASCDTIRVDNVAYDAGVLVDGATDNGAPVNDRGHARSGSGSVEINVRRLDSATAPNRNEAIAFGDRKSPRRADMSWTGSNRDRMHMALGDRIPFRVTVWIVQGPFNDQYRHAFLSCLKTTMILAVDRSGMWLQGCDIRDATNDPDITPAMLDSTGGDNRNWNDYSTRIGLQANQVNVYWINKVDNNSDWGSSDFGQRIVMGKDTGHELLVHELGHSFSLLHPAGCDTPSAYFDKTNIMWPCSTVREYVTEGQVFRMHFNAASSVNAVYNGRPGQPTETSCMDAAQTLKCPALHRRLWPDGPSFPPN